MLMAGVWLRLGLESAGEPSSRYPYGCSPSARVNCWNPLVPPRWTKMPFALPATQMLPFSSADAPITAPEADHRRRSSSRCRSARS